MKPDIYNPMTMVEVTVNGVTFLAEYTPRTCASGVLDPPEDEEIQVSAAAVDSPKAIFEAMREQVCDAVRTKLEEEDENLELERGER